MSEEREPGQEDVQLPEQPVEDLEPSEDESEDVSGGMTTYQFKRGWPSK